MKKALVVSLLLVLLLAAFSGAEDKTVQFKYKYNPGDIDKYRLLMDMDMTIPNLPSVQGMPMPTKFKLGVTVRQKVLGILPDGSAKVSISYDDFKFDVPGLPPEVAKNLKKEKMPNISVIARMSRDGKLLSVSDSKGQFGSKAMQVDQFSQIMGQLGQFGAFPDWPVKVGDGWKQTIPFPFGGGDLKIVSMVEAGALPVGKDIASKVKQTFESHMDFKDLMKAFSSAMSGSGQLPRDAEQALAQMSGGMDLNGWGVFYFSPSRGKLLKANAYMQADINIGMPAMAIQQGAPANIVMKIDFKMSIGKI